MSWLISFIALLAFLPIAFFFSHSFLRFKTPLHKHRSPMKCLLRLLHADWGIESHNHTSNLNHKSATYVRGSEEYVKKNKGRVCLFLLRARAPTTMAASFMPLHVTPHTERLSAAYVWTLEGLLTRVGMAVNLQTRGP